MAGGNVLFSLQGVSQSCSVELQSSDNPTQKAVKIAVIIQKLPPCIMHSASSSSI